MSFRSIGLVAPIALAIGGCAFVDPVDSRYDTIGRSLAKARNEAIFLNLIRASHNYPLDFVTIANVTPSMTNTTSLGLPSFLLGPHIGSYAASGAAAGSPLFTPGRDVIFGNTTASNSTAVSTNFSVSTQETSSFYQGFLKPVDLLVVNYFIRQNYPRELLFWLFVDSIEVEVPNSPQRIGSRFDPPKDYGCNPTIIDPKKRCFSDFVLLAIGSGLTIEEKTVQTSGGGQAKTDTSNGSNNASKAQTTVYNRLCFNPILARHAQALMTQFGNPWSDSQAKFFDTRNPTLSPKCGDSWDPRKDVKNPQPDNFPFQVGQIKFKIIPRSAFGVFEFLGKLMRAQREGLEPPPGRKVPYIPEERRRELVDQPKLWTVEDDQRLITVDQANFGNCFVHTWFEDGDYCVPDKAETTKTIISLLAQLIAIQTSATDLSITPLVRVVQ